MEKEIKKEEINEVEDKGRLVEIMKARTERIQEIEKLGFQAFPFSFKKKNNNSELQEKFKELEKEKSSDFTAITAGRINGLRGMGQLSFIDLMDETGKIQVLIQAASFNEKQNKLFSLLDVGDFIGVKGIVFRTKRGELSIKASKIDFLAKSIRPLPEKWHGLKDIEVRYRKRYLDMISNPTVKDVFRKRSLIIQEIRNYLNKKKFLEVETPLLQPIYGGGKAKPFKSHLNDLDMDVFLSISPELYLKRLVVGGFERVYSICKNFRNESVDRSHNPEFTMLEFYSAYWDVNDVMKTTEKMLEGIAIKINGTTKVDYLGQEVDFKAPWPRKRMVDLVKEITGIDVEHLSAEKIKIEIQEKKLKLEKDPNSMSYGLLIQELFETFCEEKLIQPTFVIEHPQESTPLCKNLRKGTNKEKFIERVEPYCLGMEIGNGYSELNNPVKQKLLLEEQARELRAGNEEANPMDFDFIEAIETGLPPTGGMGIGVDRIVMILTKSYSIRDIILFPFMKKID